MFLLCQKNTLRYKIKQVSFQLSNFQISKRHIITMILQKKIALIPSPNANVRDSDCGSAESSDRSIDIGIGTPQV